MLAVGGDEEVDTRSHMEKNRTLLTEHWSEQ